MFITDLSEIINSGQSRSVVLTGNVSDLFFNGKKYVPLIELLLSKYEVKQTPASKGIIRITYQINDDIVIIDNTQELMAAWGGAEETLADQCKRAKDSPTFALELLRQITVCARRSKLSNNLLIVIEGADLILPEAEISRMNLADRQRIAIMHDWFSDPEFMNGSDSVLLLAESKSMLHHRVSRLPQVLEVEIPLPDVIERKQFLDHTGISKSSSFNSDQLSVITAGLSIHALRQLVLQKELTMSMVVDKVEEYIKRQLGDDVVEFKKPTHNFSAIRGFTTVKRFLSEEVIPRFQSPETALSGLVLSGPIGSGKTYLGEALSTELGIPVLLLTGLRSKWFGETDIIIERLCRLLKALDKVAIFLDEADTIFGNISNEDHATEKRLTGKIQAIMSNPLLKGKVFWILMTARIHLLSPDIKRPGRMDLIIPILDPDEEDRKQFIDWALQSLNNSWKDIDGSYDKIDILTKGYSSASFSSLRSLLKSKPDIVFVDACDIARDIISSDIEAARRYQVLQALMNCTRYSLLPKSLQNQSVSDLRIKWRLEIIELESIGVR